jgi:hypothetical protein
MKRKVVICMSKGNRNSQGLGFATNDEEKYCLLACGSRNSGYVQVTA